MNGTTQVGIITLDGTEETPWKYTFTGLDKYDSKGNEIEYTITEDELKGYETTIEKFIVTNIKLVDATIIKVWSDDNNRDGIRPTSLQVQLLADGEKVEDGILTLEENEDGIWTGTITGLIKYNEDGSLITYAWIELDLPEGYELTDTTVNGIITTLTNTHKPQTRDIVVVKVWEDQDNQDNVRPTEVIVYLVVDGKETDYIVLNEANNWTGKFEGLNVYSEAEIIKYTVFEKLDTDLYEPVIKETEDGFTITNFYSPKGEEVPKTGDNIVLYIISLLISIMGLGYGFYLKKNFN